MTIFLHGTQKRFEEYLLKNGLTKENSAVFCVQEGIKKQLLFTLNVIFYHAISLNVQQEILLKHYSSFATFYESYPEKLPVILSISSNIKTFSKKNYYKQQNSGENLITYPYMKIKDIGYLHGGIQSYSVELSTILDIEKAIQTPLKEGNDRFFQKLETCNAHLPDRLLNYKLVNKEYMQSLCDGLSKKYISEQ